MPFPKVSVCIDVYNYADFLPKAIESALIQTFRDLEVIVVDDCSTDNSYAVACRYAERDDRVRVHKNPVNLGMVKNRNACLELARGEFVKFIHADDFLCAPDALEKLVGRMEGNPAASLVACAIHHVRENGSPQEGSPGHFTSKRYLAGTTVIARCLLEQKNLIGGPSATLFRRGLAARGFDEKFFHAADQEMWFHLLEQGCFGHVDEPLVAYRWHGRQQTEQDRGTLTQANDQRAILARYLDKPYLRLRPWMKRYLEYDAVRQTLRRCRKLGESKVAAEVLREYGGRKRYWLKQVNFFAWRKVKRFGGGLYRRVLPYYGVKPPPEIPPKPPQGINVAGFLKAQFGVGESSRAFCRAVTEASLSHAFVNIQSKVHNNGDTQMRLSSDVNPYGINLMTFSFDYSRRFYLDKGPGFFKGRHNIALWYWELERFPARWHSNFDYYDEIWAPTEFVRRSLAAVSPVPVYKLTYPFYPETSQPDPDRAGLGLPEDSRLFLFNFDFCSTVARKNPMAVINAFRHAFSPADKATLVLKSINSQHDPRGHAWVKDALKGLNVVWIESHLNQKQMRSLFASCDCYVSLHRSEGLGLGLVQAMSLGKPVIGTGYSGNMDYMRPGNSLLVKHELVEISDDCGPYQQGNVWAEADVNDAAEKMRWVYDHQDEAEQLGQRAAVEVRAALDPAKTREEIRARVREIYGGR
ncbi:MAG TPA: glycosyltransferase [Candidatus Acidoferrales bacterium]|jgi:glycosyltransferase involved in cell wall biosynthesis|nr:glycosyltransferase [Candidatus Acidoferrales bacterium]